MTYNKNNKNNNNKNNQPADEQREALGFVALSVSTAVEQKIALKDILGMKYCITFEGDFGVMFFDDDGLKIAPLDDATKKAVKNNSKDTITYMKVSDDGTMSFSVPKKQIVAMYCHISRK